ncbi:MAG: endonuclease, partial [Bacteroidaceae bacterium]|nr:endonuclease [Bacteroidaceae bacterium]
MNKLRFHRLFLFLFLYSAFLPDVRAQRPLRVVEWNVENLFDCRHDTLKDDQEFLPEGERRWSWGRYWRKLTDIGRVLMAIGDEAAPDLVALCEVENDSVLHDLCRRSDLRHLDFSYIITNSADRRGIDVALLYRPVRFRLLDWHAVRVPSREQGLPPTRDILWAKGLAPAGDTLHIAVCHLPSRLGG